MEEYKKNNSGTPDKRLAAVCGLFCPACTVHIGTSENPDRLNAISRRTGRPVEELQCRGCRTEIRCFYCKSICTIAKCAEQKSIDFCGSCSEYPCSPLKTFQAEMPHRIELWQSQERIKEAGYEKWYLEMMEHYSCPQCGTLNSPYDIECRKCGCDPSCEYVRLHKDVIMRHPARMK